MPECYKAEHLTNGMTIPKFTSVSIIIKPYKPHTYFVSGNARMLQDRTFDKWHDNTEIYFGVDHHQTLQITYAFRQWQCQNATRQNI